MNNIEYVVKVRLTRAEAAMLMAEARKKDASVEELQQLRETLLEPVQREVTTPYWQQQVKRKMREFEQGMY